MAASAAGSKSKRWVGVGLVVVLLGVAGYFGYTAHLDGLVRDGTTLLRSDELDRAETLLLTLRDRPLAGDRGLEGLATLAELRAVDIGDRLRASDFAAAHAAGDLFRKHLDEAGLKQFAPELSALDEIEESRRIPLVLDRNGTVIRTYDLDSAETAFDPPQLFEGWFGRMPEVSGADRVRTTLDLALQRAAHSALSGYEGVAILADPGSGELLAVVGTANHGPFTSAFEPGMVIGPLTYQAFVAGGGDAAKHAPRKYAASEKIGGQPFYDWTEAGQVESVEEGFAVSCRLMLARMGVDAGWANLKTAFAALDAAWFPGDILIAAAPPVVTGEPADDYGVATAATGTGQFRVTALGLLSIPMSVANGGEWIRPSLVLERTNAVGRTLVTASPPKPVPLFDPEVAETVGSAMALAVTHPRGTARRIESGDTAVSALVATTGSRPFDSVAVGYFPAGKPRIAFALYLDKGGKGEIHATRVITRLVEQIRKLAPVWMEESPVD